MNTKRELFKAIIEASKTLEKDTIELLGDLGEEAVKSWMDDCTEIAIRLLNVEAFTEEERTELLKFNSYHTNFLGMINGELGGEISWQLAEKICQMR